MWPPNIAYFRPALVSGSALTVYNYKSMLLNRVPVQATIDDEPSFLPSGLNRGMYVMAH